MSREVEEIKHIWWTCVCKGVSWPHQCFNSVHCPMFVTLMAGIICLFSQKLRVTVFLLLLCSLTVSESFWDSSAFETDTDLPSGWMRVRDTSGTYYWHIPTGTTQWEPPSPLGKVNDSMMSPSMSLETTPCEEPEVRSNTLFAWTETLTYEPEDNNILC